MITARRGTVAYRIDSKEQLTQTGMKELVMEALDDGRLVEPEPGGVATLVVGEAAVERSAPPDS